MNRRRFSSQSGVTLVELVVAMVVISIALGGVLLVLNYTTRHSADPVLRHQASAGATLTPGRRSQSPAASSSWAVKPAAKHGSSCGSHCGPHTCGERAVPSAIPARLQRS